VVLGTPEILARLGALLKDVVGDVRSSAAEALGTLMSQGIGLSVTSAAPGCSSTGSRNETTRAFLI